MKQSNSASINITFIYIVKEHCCILHTSSCPYTVDYKIRRKVLSNCHPGCYMLIVMFVFVTHYIISYHRIGTITEVSLLSEPLMFLSPQLPSS